MRFAILSDIHLHDARLGTGGRAYDAYLAENPNLPALSEPILEAALADIIKSRVDFVIVCGDLTKDGERANHERVVPHLDQLVQAGVSVFVVPGNHDLNNPEAVRYAGDTAIPVPSVDAAGFRALYDRFGYGQAIDHAPDSLSYVADPAPGLRLLGLDSVKSAENTRASRPLISGRVTSATLVWALDRLRQARASGKQTIAFMHHGVNPHFLAQPRVFPDYLVDDWPVVSARLAAAGLRVIFTGHYHSQDAAWALDANGTPQRTLCDIETGSLVMWPCAYRIAELDGAGQLHIESRRITRIAADLGGVPFPEYAETRLRSLLPGLVRTRLQHLFRLNDPQIQQVQPLLVEALLADYAGDAVPSTQAIQTLEVLRHSPDPFPLLGELIGTLWISSSGADNHLVVPV